MVKRIEQFLNHNDKVLDIGSGTCSICKILIKNKYKVVPLDIENLSLLNEFKPIIYNGHNIPFKKNSFNVSIILTVLHHTTNPEMMIKEAMRVSQRIIIMEEIYNNAIHKYVTFFIDNLFNLKLISNAHGNRTDIEWKLLFKKLGLIIRKVIYERRLFVLLQATYYLEKS